jgi:hypothetical protein
MFPTQNEWKSAMMTLPDDAFFDLLRSVFGHIKTPFNKQNLLAELTAFLSRDDIRRNIAGYIDDADAQIIAAVAMLHSPTAGELGNFFSGNGGTGNAALDIQGILLNLEERFILYRFRDGKVFRLALNPVLEPVLKSIAEDVMWILPSESLSGGSNTAHAGDRLLAALYAFTLGEVSIFKAEGRIRKKTLDAGKKLFPGIDLEASLRGLLSLGLFRLAGESLVPEDHALRAFGDIESRQRLMYWAAGIYVSGSADQNNGDEGLPTPQLIRGQIRYIARIINKLLGIPEDGRAYPAVTLRRFLVILEREEAGESSGEGGPTLQAVSPAVDDIDIEALCKAMGQAGLLCHGPQGYYLAAPPPEPCDVPVAGLPVTGLPVAGLPTDESQPVLVMDAPFFCLVHPGVQFTDVLALASFTLVRETGAVFRFELTRESSQRGFERGMSAAAMGELLNRLSGNRVEPLVHWTLLDWEKRYGEVSLFEGAVLSLSPDRRYLAEALASLILRELAPGLYLLASGDKAAEALRKAGVDIFAHLAGPQGSANNGESQFGGAFNLFPPLGRTHQWSGYQDSADPAILAAEHAVPGRIAKEEAAESLKADFRKALSGRSLSRIEREELSARIERRLVLVESQLSSASIRYEKLEARGLDYVGKASIARQALNSHSPVEVVWSAADITAGGIAGVTGKEQRITGVPLGLEKSGGESILVIEDVRIPGDAVRIPLGKISLIRRIKKSIFEN